MKNINNTQQPPFYEDNVAASDPLRVEQVQELEAYIGGLKASKAQLNAVFTPRYGSVREYIASTKPLRERLAETHGYPPPGLPDKSETPSFVQIGEDAIGVYYRAKIPVLPGVHAEGIYIVPKNIKGKVPLVISMHGGNGSPEVALFHGGANYNDMVRGGVKNGYAVFAPQHLFQASGYPNDIRQRTDTRLRLQGTTLTAVEVTKITRSLDVLLGCPEIDAKRVAMVGLSYGGYYSLITTALEPRIKVVVSSCYFGIQEHRYAQDDLSVPSDFHLLGRMSVLQDPEIVALICPRPLLIQAGKTDDLVVPEASKNLASAAATYYQRLGKTDKFEFVVFEGWHEFHDASAWAFVKKHLG
jgi:dienelactone hydrolase